MFNFFNKTNADVKRDVINELMWDPKVSSSQVKVSADDGIVTLSGTVPHYIEKLAAEQAAQRVHTPLCAPWHEGRYPVDEWRICRIDRKE